MKLYFDIGYDYLVVFSGLQLAISIPKGYANDHNIILGTTSIMRNEQEKYY